MRQYLFGVLLVFLGSQVLCEYSNGKSQENLNSFSVIENRDDEKKDRDTSSDGSISSDEDDYVVNDDFSSTERNQGFRHARSYSYSGEDVSGNNGFDQYPSMDDDVAYWDSIYGTEDIPEFDMPPPIDGDSIFLDMQDFTDQSDEALIISMKRDAGESRSHTSQTSSSAKRSENVENLRQSFNSDYQSMMSDVYRPNFYGQNPPERKPEMASGYQGDENKQFHGSEGSAETVSSSFSNLEQQESDWSAKNSRKSESRNGEILNYQGIAGSELESAEQVTGNLKTRSVISSDVADSLFNSKRKIIQSKQDLINVAAGGGTGAEVSDALHSVMEGKRDFIDSVVSAKVHAIEGKVGSAHPVTDFESSHGYFANGHILGSPQARGSIQTVLDSKQKIIQAKKDLINIGTSGGGRGEISNAARRTIAAKKDLVDSVASAKANAIGSKKEFIHSIGGFGQSQDYSVNSKNSGSTGYEGMLQSVSDSTQKIIQAKKDLIHASAVGSKTELTDAIIGTLDAKKALVDSILSTAGARISHENKDFGYSTHGAENKMENFHRAAHRHGSTSSNTNSRVSATKYTNRQSGSTNSQHNVHDSKHSSRVTRVKNGKSSSHSSSSASSNIAVGGEFEVVDTSRNNYPQKGSYTSLNEKTTRGGQISSDIKAGLTSSQRGIIQSSTKSGRINLAGIENSGTKISSGFAAIRDEVSSLRGSSSGNGNIDISEKIGVASSSSASHHQKGGSLSMGTKAQSGNQISDHLQLGLTGRQSGIHSSASSSSGVIDDSSSYGIQGSIGNSKFSSSKHVQASKVGETTDITGTISSKIALDKNLDLGDGFQLGLKTGGTIELMSSSSESSSEEINDSAAYEIQGSIGNSKFSSSKHVQASKVGETTDITGTISSKIALDKNLDLGDGFHLGLKTGGTIELVSSSSESSSEEISDSVAFGIQGNIKNSEVSNTKYVSKSIVGEETDITGSISSKITLNKNLAVGDVTRSGLKTEGTINSDVSTRSNMKTATILGGTDTYATLDATKIVEIEGIDSSQSIEENCPTRQCGVSGKLHVDLNTKHQNSFNHKDELKNIVKLTIPQNLNLSDEDEEIMNVNIQSPNIEGVIIDTRVEDDNTKEHPQFADYLTDFETKRKDEVTVEYDNGEKDQYTEQISTVGNVERSDEDVSSESYFTGPEISFNNDEETSSGQVKEYQSVGSKSEHKFGIQTVVPEVFEVGEEDSIAVEKSRNDFVRTEVEGTIAQQDEEQRNLAIERHSGFQVTVKNGSSKNGARHEDQSSTYDKQFGKHYSSAAHQRRVSQNREKTHNFQSFDGSSIAHLPQDVELYADDGTITNGHCCLINLSVNCSGATAFMKPECQQLNTNLWRPQESGSPITLWTIKSHLSQGQKLAKQMQNRAKWLCDKGFTPKLHTPAMLHLINNWATENTVEINQESEVSLFGTKLLQRRLSYDFDFTPNTFIEFLNRHAFRVIGTGLCHARAKRCPVNQMYRSFDGSCNNRVHTTWGKCDTAFSRILPARYHDGVHEPPRSVTGRQLPNPRTLSVHCFSRKRISELKLTLAVSQWGQILSHDFAFQTADQTVKGGIQCCDDGKGPLPDKLRHHSCLPIGIPSDDQFYSNFGLRCMNFVRSMTIAREDCTLGPAEQLNTVTSYLDASPVYGSNKETCDQLRAFKGGEMLVTVDRGRELLPTMTNRSRFCDVRSPSEVCYRAGDVRINQNPQLALMQTVLVREHNRIARELTVLNPHWDDERVFHETRRIVIALHQYITYNEWLPLVIGKKYCQKHRLSIRRGDTLSPDYNPRIKAATINSFTTAAFRLFHSMVAGNMELCPASRQISHALRLSNHYFRPQVITRSEHFDDLLRGLTFQKMGKSDKNFDPEITEYLFRSKNEFGMDLEALDIQRGRDHALQSYNAYRKICGLPRARYFDDLITEIPQESIEKLKEHYAHVDDIDLFVGLVLETSSSDGIVGPVARCLIGEQFYRSKVGDRYFYSHADQPHSFTPEQFEEIRKASFARLLCDNGDNIEEIQPQAFKIISRTNPLTCCGALPRIDLRQWRELECVC